jgi:hypothetical protein
LKDGLTIKFGNLSFVEDFRKKGNSWYKINQGKIKETGNFFVH